MLDINCVEKKLRNSGYKLTNQRKAIIEVLFEHKGQFISADEIYKKTQEKHPDTNFSTVYRNLTLLENAGIIQNTRIDNERSVYEIVDSDSHHHNIICKGCGKTEPIDFCPFDEINLKLGNSGFTLTDHKFELYGYCRECEKKALKRSK